MKLTFIILCTLPLLLVEGPGVTHQLGWFSFGSTTNQTAVTTANNKTTNITAPFPSANSNTSMVTNSIKTPASSSSYSYLSLLNPFYWLSSSSSSTSNSTVLPVLSPLSRLTSRGNQPEENTRRMDAADDPAIGSFNSNRITPLTTTTTIAPTIQEVPIKRINSSVTNQQGSSGNLQPRTLTSNHQQYNSTAPNSVASTNRPVAILKATLVTSSPPMRSSYMMNQNHVNGSSISNMFTTSRPSLTRSMGATDFDTHSLIKQKTSKMMFIRRNGQNHLVQNNQYQPRTQIANLTSLSATTTPQPIGSMSTPVSPTPIGSVSDASQNPLILVVVPSSVASDQDSQIATTSTINNNNKAIAHDQISSTIATSPKTEN